MKMKFILPCALILALILSGCGAAPAATKPADTETVQTTEENNGYPQIVLIDDVLYYGTDEKCGSVPRRTPDGTIETFVEPEIMPDAINSANFGSEYGTLEYMFAEDGRLMVHVGEDWFWFESRDAGAAEGNP